MVDQYAVFGNPINHSKSPLLHASFARRCGQTISYRAILAPVDGFSPALQSFIDQGGRGANVTVPFKLEAFALCDEVTPRANTAAPRPEQRHAVQAASAPPRSLQHLGAYCPDTSCGGAWQ